uniref:Uncharacterized protein n=1 Tax=Graphocephala atropunctata TaxID=36148 RepID=A0A1B6L0W9_9HEMI
MDELGVNPLELSLDEVIALNKMKNREEETEEIENEEIPMADEIIPNGFSTSGLSMQEIETEQRLRRMPGFGTKPMHLRLGCNYFKRRRFLNFRQKYAYKRLNNARQSYWKKQSQLLANATITLKNSRASESPFISPLTRHSVDQFNKLNGGLASSAIGSTRSIISSRSTFLRRHSAKSCLNPTIQEEIKTLLMSLSTELIEESAEVYKPTQQENEISISTHARFSSYI